MRFQVVLFLLTSCTSLAYLPELLAGKGVELSNLKSPTNVTVDATCILGTQTGCSTAVAEGLTNQIIKELNSMGYSFKSLDSTWIRCSRYWYLLRIF